MNNLDTNPFQNIIQLEEITHFQKPHNQPPKSILATHKYKSSSPLDYDYQNGFGGNKSGKKVSYSLNKDDEPIPSTSSEKIFSHLSEPGQFSNNFDHEYDASLRYGPTTSDSQPHSSGCNGRIGFRERINEEDDSESDTEFRRDFTQLPTRGRGDPDQVSIKSSGSQDSHGSGRRNNGFFYSGISDENLFPLPNDIEVTRSDVIFAIIVFIIHLGELVTDCTLTVWHYRDGQKWGCLFTVTLIATGAVSMLHQFGFIQ